MLPNLHTVKLDPQFIREIIARYVIQGVVKQCEYTLPPHNVSPLSLVPKDSITTPWRVVTDLRLVNTIVRPQKTSLPTLARSQYLWTPGAFVSAQDVSQAYHAAGLARCQGGLQKDLVPNSDGSTRYYISCTPNTCLGACDKATHGFFFEGHFYGFAVPVFGGKASNCSLAALTRPITRLWRSQGLKLILYIDD